MDIQWAPSPNIWKGRNGRSIIAIVNHITAGNFPGCLSWMQNPASKASAHYLVTRAGEIYQLVADEDSAFHAGAVARPSWSLYDGTNPNRYTIGIEHEGFDGELTEAQYQATLWLQRMLCRKWGIPADPDHIIGHYMIDAVNRPNCPGPNFPWQRLFADLTQPAYPTVNINVAGFGQLQGVIINSRSLAPVADLAKALGHGVQWDAGTNTVIVLPYTGPTIAATRTVKIAVGGQLLPGTIINSRSYAPVAALAQALGRQVGWDAGTDTVLIS